MATPPGGGEEVPQAGYYPDPSIPGYIRYWNGGAWVPGTSRPAPPEGQVPPQPPASAIPAGPILASGPTPAPVQPSARATARPAEPTEPLRHTDPARTPEPARHTGPARTPEPVRTPDPVRTPEPVRTQGPGPVQTQGHVQPQGPAPVQPAASVPAQHGPVGAQPQHRAAAPAQAQAHVPVPAVEETGPVFFDEEPAAPEPASAWQADSARQTGFGGDLDRKVSWGAPRAADPRTPAEWPVAGATEQAEAPAEVPARGPDPRATGGAARLGGMPVTPIPTPSPEPVQPRPEPQLRPQPQPAPRPRPAQSAPAPAAAAVPTPTPAPAAPSWAQQQQQSQQPQQPQSSQEQQPVVPWKPPVEDVFQQAAREQAAARPAGLGRRLAARLIDTVVLGALVGAASFPFVTAALDHIDGKIEAARQSGVTVQVWLVDSTTAVQFGIALAALFVLGVLYEALPTAKWGRTLGKKVCGLQVRDIEGHQPPTFGKAFVRWFLYSVLGLLAIGVLNVLWCLFDRPWRQCWHDKAARTFVAR
ncbi:RDD family protein [Streptomyces sp. NPDC056361]|uniref:RDD family protein n=1 Tax=Streptomyces sp. NPDC056361 TaxID=3345795 RepID=UPI0035E16CEF